MADNRLKELLEAGAHFGHQTRRWNPKMKQFIYGTRGGVHIIDLTKTEPLLAEAVDFVEKTAARGGKVMLVGTKRQISGIVREEAEAAGLSYVTERWLGGMLTNFRTIKLRVNRLKKLEAGLDSGEFAKKYNKKELLDFTNEVADLNRIFSGIKKLDQMPAVMFVVDTPNESIAIAEARRLGIKVVAIADTNSNPDEIDYIIPANDDALKSVKLITHLVAQAAAAGTKTYETKRHDEAKPEKEAK
jgi:small subunit ribosomal protein S2